MIEADATILIDASIDNVWNYVQDIRRWANIMPGMRECTVVDAENSRWTLKVGVGGLVRTVKVVVHVDEWDRPQRVHFSYQLEGDPVAGSGSFLASVKEAQEQTDVTLRVRVEGSGALAPMWEAMSRPLLPQLAKSFAGKLKAEIERTVAGSASSEAVATDSTSMFANIRKRLRNSGDRD